MRSAFLDLLILDSAADDWESVATIRLECEPDQFSLASVPESTVTERVWHLLASGYMTLGEVGEDAPRVTPVDISEVHASDLSDYWFEPTAAGRTLWREGIAELDAFYDSFDSNRGRTG